MPSADAGVWSWKALQKTMDRPIPAQHQARLRTLINTKISAVFPRILPEIERRYRKYGQPACDPV
jgi:hypothetical protein